MIRYPGSTDRGGTHATQGSRRPGRAGRGGSAHRRRARAGRPAAGRQQGRPHARDHRPGRGPDGGDRRAERDDRPRGRRLPGRQDGLRADLRRLGRGPSRLRRPDHGRDRHRLAATGEDRGLRGAAAPALRRVRAGRPPLRDDGGQQLGPGPRPAHEHRGGHPADRPEGVAHAGPLPRRPDGLHLERGRGDGQRHRRRDEEGHGRGHGGGPRAAHRRVRGRPLGLHRRPGRLRAWR